MEDDIHWLVARIIGNATTASKENLEEIIQGLRDEVGGEYYEGRGDPLFLAVANWIENLYADPGPYKDKRREFEAEYKKLCQKHGCYISGYDCDEHCVVEGDRSEDYMFRSADEVDERNSIRDEKDRKEKEDRERRKAEEAARPHVPVPDNYCQLLPYYGPGSPWGTLENPTPQWKPLPGWPFKKED